MVFYLKFCNVGSQVNDYTIAQFEYDGCTHQSGFTLEQWKQRCIKHWKANDCTYKGEVTFEEYEKWSNSLKRSYF